MSIENKKYEDKELTNTPSAVNPNSNNQTKALLTYLWEIYRARSQKVISGVFSLQGLKEVYDATGMWAGLLGVEYCTGFGLPSFASAPDAISWKSLNPGMIEHWKAGGILRVLTHFPNPTNAKYGGLRDSYADVDAILTAGTPERDRWLALLDEIAAGFHDLEKEGVSVIYGPLHENQGDKDSESFWWCTSQTHMGTERYIALWRDIIARICSYNSCNNIIWLWSPLGFLPEEYINLLLECYPGDKYVDLIGMDIYDNTLKPYIENYKVITRHNKPFMLGEFGPMKYYLKPGEQEPYDCRDLLKDIRGDWAKTIGFMFWDDQFLPNRQKYAVEMMHDSMVLNRGFRFE